MQIVVMQMWTALADVKGLGHRALGSVICNVSRLAVRDSWNLLMKSP